jgi:2-C-methyl-D-erythritol 2,4-cyclodiphosphate synthase
MRVGMGYDIHPVGGDRPLVLGGVELPGPGLVGHSDGDVVAHAVADALLGAAGLGDLGTLFPASDEAFAGADSVALLADVFTRVTAEGWFVNNVDVVIAAEAPKLAAHVPAMVENVGRAVGGAPVSLKAKSGEGVGVIGRGEAVAAWAVAMLDQR